MPHVSVPVHWTFINTTTKTTVSKIITTIGGTIKVITVSGGDAWDCSDYADFRLPLVDI